MLLQNRKYVLSAAYSATGNGVYDIFRMLKVLKQYVIRLTTDNQ
jgi:hypothetical protein